MLRVTKCYERLNRNFQENGRNERETSRTEYYFRYRSLVVDGKVDHFRISISQM